MNVIVILYCVGVACYFMHSVWLLHLVYRGGGVSITVKSGSTLIFKVGLHSYLLIRTLFWPYFLFFQTNPFNYLSSTLFKYYGAQGVTYCGSRGLYNLLNDVFRGKHRYKDYEIKFFNFRCVHEGKVYQEYLTYVSEPQNIIYAKVILAKHIQKPDTYLFVQAIHFEQSTETVKHVSLYDLDRGERLSRHALETRLRDINPQAVSLGLEGWGK